MLDYYAAKPGIFLRMRAAGACHGKVAATRIAITNLPNNEADKLQNLEEVCVTDAVPALRGQALL
jgi:hypothetical protein